MNYPDSSSHAPTVRIVRAMCLGTLAGMAAGAALAPLPAAAQGVARGTPELRHYAIPAGPLEATLNRLGRETGVLIAFDAASAEGVRSPGVNGAFTVADALAHALAGTGRELVRGAGGSYTLRVAPSAAAVEQAPSATIGQVVITGQAMRDTTTEGSSLYVARGSSVGGKMVQTVREVPQTVSIMTSQEIRDQALDSVHEVLLKMPGVAQFQGTMANSRYLSRGFEIGNTRVDGAAALGLVNGPDDDTAFYDHVEVLRGADGLFGAAAEPGGTVNLVRKKPTMAPQVLAQVQAGSNEFRRIDLDAGGALRDDGTVRGRVVMVQEDKDFFYKDTHSDRSMVYAIVEADLASATRLTLGGIYNKRKSSYQGYGLPRFSDGGDLRLPRDFQLSGADDHENRKTKSVFARVDQRLGRDWNATFDMNYEDWDQDRFDHYFSGAVDRASGAGIASFGGGTRADERVRNTGLDLNLTGRFDWLGRTHQLVAGASWQNVRYASNQYSDDTDRTIPDVFAFDPRDYRMARDMYMVSDLYQVRRQGGLYASVDFRLADPLRVIVGGRYSRFDYSYRTKEFDRAGPTGTSDTSYHDRGVFSPYLAGVVVVDKTWSTYGSIAETYKSQAGNLSGPLPGKPLEAVTGRNYELGLKGEHWGGKLNSAFALYRIERKNAAVRDSRYPPASGAAGSSCCYIADGNIISKGFDAELGGQVAPGVQVSASYNYNTNVDKNAGDGRYQALTPRHMAKLFGTWQLPWQRDWKIGGGVNVQSDTAVSGTAYATGADGSLDEVAYRFHQGGYAVWTAFADYRIDDRWQLQLNVNNAADKHYYATVGYVDYGNFYGAPRNARLTLRGSF